MRCVFVVVLVATAVVSDGVIRASEASAQGDGGGDQVLMVVGSVSDSGLPPSKDRPVVALLGSMGYEVELINDDDVTVADIGDSSVVVVSSSVSPPKIGSMFVDVTTPVVTWEGYLFDDFGFTSGSHGETGSVQTTLTIADESHPIAAGYSRTVSVSSSALRFSYAETVPSAQVIAQVGVRPVVFGFDAGAALVEGTAQARRVGLFMNYGTAGVLRSAGRDIVAAAVAWAAAGEPGNRAPVVDAGPDLSIVMPANSVSLDGTISDDGLPEPASLTSAWSQISGPTGVSFVDAAAEDTTATFPGVGEYVLQLSASDGELSSSDDVIVTVNAELPEGINVAYVSSKLTLPGGDRPIRDHFEARGATVTPVEDDALLDDYDHFDLIFLSTSVVFDKIGDHFAQVDVPVITTEQYLLDDMGMAAPRLGVRRTTSIDIMAPGHELAAGEAGTVTLTTSPTSLGYGQPGPGAMTIASALGESVYFAYKTGDEMVEGMTAPARRVAFPSAYGTSRLGTDSYFDLLDAAINFALTPDNESPRAVDDRYLINNDLVLQVDAEDMFTAFGDQGSELGQFEGPGGVALTADGRVVIADRRNDRVQVCDIDGESCYAFGPIGTEPGLPKFLSGLALTADGRVVITDQVNHRVQVCGLDGQSCQTFGGQGNTAGKFNRPNGVALTNDGRVIVTDTFNHRVQVCDLAGASCEAFGSNGEGAGEFNRPSGVTVTADNRVVIADALNHRMQICDIDFTSCEVFASRGTEPGQFNRPSGVTAMADGRLAISDGYTSRIQVCEIDFTSCETFGSWGKSLGKFRFPAGLVLTGDGRFVIADQIINRMQIFAPGGVLANDSDPEGAMLTVVASDSASASGAVVTVNEDGSFTYDPTGVPAAQALAPGETLTDTFGYTVSDGITTATATVTVTISGAPEMPAPVALDDNYLTQEDLVLTVAAEETVSAFGSAGSNLGEFSSPGAVAATRDGRIVVSDVGNNRVQICDVDGTNCEVLTGLDVGLGDFAPGGVAVARDGRIVVSEPERSQLRVCDVAGSPCLQFGNPGAGLGEFSEPDAVAVTADGRVVVADRLDSRVQVCDITFVTCAAFGGVGSELGQFNAPQGVALTSDGRVVIADTLNHRVQVCAIDGTGCVAFGDLGSELGQFDGPAGVAVTADNRIVVGDASNSRVQVCDFDGTNCQGYAIAGSDVAVTADGLVLIADTSNSQIHVLGAGGVLANDSDPDGDLLTVTNFEASSAQGATVILNADGSFVYDPTNAAAIAALNDGQIIADTFRYTVSDGINTATATVTVTVAGVSDNAAPDTTDDNYQITNDHVLMVAADRPPTAFSGSATGPGTFTAPAGVALLPDGRIVVADRDNSRVQVCDVDGVACDAFGSLGTAPGEFNLPGGVAVTADGRIVVADTENSRVQVCAVDGSTCDAFGSSGTAVGEFRRPGGVAVSASGRIIIADSRNHRVQVCDVDGAACEAFGTKGADLGQFLRPDGVAEAADGRIVVADSYNNRVQVCAGDGSVCSAFGTLGTELGQFNRPLGVAVNASGRIVVADAFRARIQTCDDDGTSCEEFGSFGTELGELRRPADVVIARDGTLLVADLNNNRIQIFWPSDVLSNDSDPDGDSLTLVGFSSVSTSGASVMLDSDGVLNYDPTVSAAAQGLAVGDTLVDTFTYGVSDGSDITTATVTVIVTGN